MRLTDADKGYADNKFKPPCFEQFRIVLTHEYIDEDGKKQMLDEPLVICCTNIWSNHASVTLSLNEMMDKMRWELLKRYTERGEKNDKRIDYGRGVFRPCDSNNFDSIRCLL